MGIFSLFKLLKPIFDIFSIDTLLGISELREVKMNFSREFFGLKIFKTSLCVDTFLPTQYSLIDNQKLREKQIITGKGDAFIPVNNGLFSVYKTILEASFQKLKRLKYLI